MITNPYEIFARDILKLYKLDPLGGEPDHALRGRIVHQAVHMFVERHPTSLPAEIEGELVDIADALFKELGGSPRVEAFWRPQFQRFARWFALTEPGRRAGGVTVHAEVEGELALDAGRDFTLTARADRIDVAADGSVVIYDYKSGTAPLAKHVDGLSAPQLPLEAAIAKGGGFAALGARAVAGLRYIEASGRRDGGKERSAADKPAGALADEARQRLIELIARFDQADTPYEAKRRRGPFSNAYRFDDYAQLARVKEWATANAEEEP
jgi:ATP-dependent helicase/nuclease subunit B